MRIARGDFGGSTSGLWLKRTSEFKELTASLKRCPDTKLEFPGSLFAQRPTTIDQRPLCSYNPISVIELLKTTRTGSIRRVAEGHWRTS